MSASGVLLVLSQDAPTEPTPFPTGTIAFDAPDGEKSVSEATPLPPEVPLAPGIPTLIPTATQTSIHETAPFATPTTATQDEVPEGGSPVFVPSSDTDFSWQQTVSLSLEADADLTALLSPLPPIDFINRDEGYAFVVTPNVSFRLARPLLQSYRLEFRWRALSAFSLRWRTTVDALEAETVTIDPVTATLTADGAAVSLALYDGWHQVKIEQHDGLRSLWVNDVLVLQTPSGVRPYVSLETLNTVWVDNVIVHEWLPVPVTSVQAESFTYDNMGHYPVGLWNVQLYTLSWFSLLQSAVVYYNPQQKDLRFIGRNRAGTLFSPDNARYKVRSSDQRQIKYDAVTNRWFVQCVDQQTGWMEICAASLGQMNPVLTAVTQDVDFPTSFDVFGNLISITSSTTAGYSTTLSRLDGAYPPLYVTDNCYWQSLTRRLLACHSQGNTGLYGFDTNHTSIIDTAVMVGASLPDLRAASSGADMLYTTGTTLNQTGTVARAALTFSPTNEITVAPVAVYQPYADSGAREPMYWEWAGTNSVFVHAATKYCVASPPVGAQCYFLNNPQTYFYSFTPSPYASVEDPNYMIPLNQGNINGIVQGVTFIENAIAVDVAQRDIEATTTAIAAFCQSSRITGSINVRPGPDQTYTPRTVTAADAALGGHLYIDGRYGEGTPTPTYGGYWFEVIGSSRMNESNVTGWVSQGAFGNLPNTSPCISATSSVVGSDPTLDVTYIPRVDRFGQPLLPTATPRPTVTVLASATPVVTITATAGTPVATLPPSGGGYKIRFSNDLDPNTPSASFAWSPQDMVAINTAVQYIGEALQRHMNAASPVEAFNRVMVNGDTPDYVYFYRANGTSSSVNIQYLPGGPANLSVTVNVGACQTFNSLPRVVVCNWGAQANQRSTYPEQTIVHELGHVFTNRSRYSPPGYVPPPSPTPDPRQGESQRGLLFAAVESTFSSTCAPAFVTSPPLFAGTTFPSDCVIIADPRLERGLVMGLQLQPEGTPSIWRRGTRGWGSVPNGVITQFQQHPVPFPGPPETNDTQVDETAADMFLNWVYRRRTDDTTASIDYKRTSSVPEPWSGFANIDAAGNFDPNYPGDARYEWMNIIMTRILQLKAW